MDKPTPEHDHAHDLMPDWLAAEMPALHTSEGVEDPTVRAKFFTPDSSWTWFVLEYSPLERLCFGLVDGHEKELGYFSLGELESVRGPLGLPVERDLYFASCPLSQVRSVTTERRGAHAMTPTGDEFTGLYVEDEEHPGQWHCARCGAQLAYDPVVGLYCADCDLEHDETDALPGSRTAT